MAMTRRQAENLAKGNPKIAARLAAGEYDAPPGGSGSAPGNPRASAPKRKTVRAAAPPANPGGRPRAPRDTSRSSGSRAPRSAPRSTPDNDPPKRDGFWRSLGRGIFDV